MFTQDLKQFFKSKTNQAALISIVGTGASWYMGEIVASVALPLLLGSVFAITLKDAIAKK